MTEHIAQTAIATTGGRSRRIARRLTAALAVPAIALAVLTHPTAAAAAGPIPPNSLVAGVASTTLSFSENDLVVAGLYQYNGPVRVFYTTGRGGGTPSWSHAGWEEVPGHGQSSQFTPAVARGTLKSYVVINGADNKMWIQVAYDEWGGISWNPGWQQIPGNQQFKSPPRVSFASNTLTVTATGLDGWFYRKLLDTNTGVWTNWFAVNLATTLREGTTVSSTTLNGEPVFAMTGSDQRVYVGEFQGYNVNWREVPGGGRSNHTPALAVTGANVLNVVVSGTEYNPGRLYYQAAAVSGQLTPPTGGPTWRSAWSELPGGGHFYNANAPAASRTFGGNLHVYQTGSDGALWTAAYGNPVGTLLQFVDGYQYWQPVPGSSAA